jgi:hypothetical protein
MAVHPLEGISYSIVANWLNRSAFLFGQGLARTWGSLGPRHVQSPDGVDTVHMRFHSRSFRVNCAVVLLPHSGASIHIPTCRSTWPWAYHPWSLFIRPTPGLYRYYANLNRRSVGLLRTRFPSVWTIRSEANADMQSIRLWNVVYGRQGSEYRRSDAEDRVWEAMEWLGTSCSLEARSGHILICDVCIL